MNEYDCTHDVKEHIFQVGYILSGFVIQIHERIKNHDASKLQEPEKSMFDEFTPKLKQLEFGSGDYKQALSDMGVALKHHYENNRHHPEHFENGVSEMTLVDILEMVADWIVAAKTKGVPVNLEYLSERFSIDAQLVSIIKNTIDTENTWYLSTEAQP